MKLKTRTPCGLVPRNTWETEESLPAASIPCSTTSSALFSSAYRRAWRSAIRSTRAGSSESSVSLPVSAVSKSARRMWFAYPQ